MQRHTQTVDTSSRRGGLQVQRILRAVVAGGQGCSRHLINSWDGRLIPATRRIRPYSELTRQPGRGILRAMDRAGTEAAKKGPSGRRNNGTISAASDDVSAFYGAFLLDINGRDVYHVADMASFLEVKRYGCTEICHYRGRTGNSEGFVASSAPHVPRYG